MHGSAYGPVGYACRRPADRIDLVCGVAVRVARLAVSRVCVCVHYELYDSRLALFMCPWERTNLYAFQDSESPIQPHTYYTAASRWRPQTCMYSVSYERRHQKSSCIAWLSTPTSHQLADAPIPISYRSTPTSSSCCMHARREETSPCSSP